MTLSRPPADLGHPLSRMGFQSIGVRSDALVASGSATASRLTCRGPDEKIDWSPRMLNP
jgi:hypothetical protein